MARLQHTLWLVFFAVMTFGAWWNVRGQFAARHWTPTLCQIERSETVRESYSTGDHFVFQVRYRYTVAGQSFTADRYSFSTTGGRYGEPEEADALVRRWEAGTETTCWVDPRDPAEAVLDPTEGWEWGLVCLFIGALPLLMHWLQLPPRPSAEGVVEWRAVAWKDFWFAVVTAGVLVPAFLGLSLAPVWQTAQARGWPETPCKIVSSRVISWEREFEPEIVFSWQHEGRTFRSAQSSFAAWHGGLPAVEAFVARYPAGTEKTCFVNPRDPAAAVLDRGYHFDVSVEVFGLTFALLMLLWVWRAARRVRHGLAAAAEMGGARYDLELFFPGISTGTWGWIAISLINVAILAPIVWREWKAGEFPTIYGILFIGAVISLAAAVSVGWLRRRRREKHSPLEQQR